MNLDTGIRLWRWGNAVSCFGVAQFLFLSALAMQSYPGGTIADQHTVGYSFFENFLSDLGMTLSWSLKPNGTACLLFNTAVVVLGFSIIPFFLFLPTHASDQWESLRIAAAFGVISALALVAIGLSPYDVHPGAHVAALVLWVMSLSSAAVLHFGALCGEQEVLPAACGAEPRFGDGNLPVHGCRLRHRAEVPGALRLVWYMVFGVRMVCKAELRPPERHDPLDRVAEAYLRRLHGGRPASSPALRPRRLRRAPEVASRQGRWQIEEV